jgi:D-amino-acid oxidase
MTPPRLDDAYLGKQVHCYRPMRRGTPNLSVEVQGDQLIAHNYGHGGSGWTLAPGSAAYVVDLAEESEQSKSLAKDAPITVVGAGVIGLFTAYELVKRGYTNVTVVAEQYEGLTSHNAGGLLAPVSMDNAPEMQVIIDKIGVDAYKFYASVAKGTDADFPKGASIVPAYFDSREDSGLEPYVGQVMEPAKDVTLDFGNGTTRDMVVYDDGIFMDPGGMMQSLRDYLEGKVTFEQRKVTDFADLPADVVFDCSGLGAKALEGDQEMVSVQGHLIMLKDQVPADLQSMILVYYPKDKTASGQEVKRSFYLFPKQLPGSGPNDIGVVGGTFIEGATPETPNDEEFQIMIDGAKRFYGIA